MGVLCFRGEKREKEKKTYLIESETERDGRVGREND